MNTFDRGSTELGTGTHTVTCTVGIGRAVQVRKSARKSGFGPISGRVELNCRLSLPDPWSRDAPTSTSKTRFAQVMDFLLAHVRPDWHV